MRSAVGQTKLTRQHSKFLIQILEELRGEGRID